MEITDTLLRGEHIACSDEDNDRLWSEVSVGFDTHRNFVVELEETRTNRQDLHPRRG